jgi:hypothetical protein
LADNDKTAEETAQAKLRESLAYQQEIRQKNILEYNKEILKDSNSILDLKSKELQGQLDLLKAYQDEIKIFEKIEAVGGKLTQEEQKRLNTIKQYNIENEKTLRNAIRTVDASKRYSDSISNSLTSFTGIGRESNNFLGKMIQATSQGAHLGLVFQDIKDKFIGINGLANLLVAGLDLVVSKTIELALEQDKAFAKFEKEAGNVNLYKESIMKLRDENGKYLISVTNATEAFLEYKKGFAGFQDLSKTNRDTLAETSAQLQKLGFNLKDLVVNQDIFIKSMGMSIQQADNFQKSLYATSLQMSLPFDKLSKDFPKASAILIARGKEMDKIFIDLQKSSKETGIQFDKLLTLAGKFNTFDSAASSAGNLNAILQGDYFNSLELINASESERIRILQERLRLNGMNINDMDQSIQLAIAQELGFSDLNDLHKAMNNEISKGTYESIKAKEAQDAMNEAIKNAAEFTEQWNFMLTKFALNMKPVLDFLKDIVSAINKIDKDSFKFISLTVAATGFVAAIILAVKAITTFAAISKAASLIAGAGGLAGNMANAVPAIAKWTTGIGNAAAGAGKLGPAVAGAGNSAAAAWPSILAFGGALLLAGVGIKFAAEGLAELVKAFDNTVQAAYALAAIGIVFVGFSVILYILTGAIGAFASAGSAAALPLLALGGAMVLVGLGIGLAAEGLSMLVMSFSGLGENAEAAAWGIGIFTLAFLGLMGAIAFMITGPQAAIAAGAVGFLMTLGAVSLAISLSVFIASNAIANLSDSVSKLFTTLSTVDSENISKAMNALWDSLSGWGVVKFASFASDAEMFVNALKPMTASAVALASALKEINNTTLRPTVDMDAVKNFTEGFAAINGATSRPGGVTPVMAQAPINITLEIDKQKLAEIMTGTVKFKDGVIQIINEKTTKN